MLLLNTKNMNLKELKTSLKNMEEVNFILPNGSYVPSHFHLTEIGLSTKTFMDCGGSRHDDHKVTLQLWTSIDYHHRLKAVKFLNIIRSSDSLFESEELEVEVEYQTETVGKYGLSFDSKNFRLSNTQTDCLATELCGIDAIKTKAKKSLESLGKVAANTCTPGAGCC